MLFRSVGPLGSANQGALVLDLDQQDSQLTVVHRQTIKTTKGAAGPVYERRRRGTTHASTAPAKKLYKLNDDYLYTLDRESTTNYMGYPMCAQLFRSVSLVSSSDPALLRRFLYSEFKVQQAAYDMQGGQAYFDA